MCFCGHKNNLALLPMVAKWKNIKEIWAKFDHWILSNKFSEVIRTKKSSMRPLRFLLNVYLSESLQKSDRIHTQSFEVSILWTFQIKFQLILKSVNYFPINPPRCFVRGDIDGKIIFRRHISKGQRMVCHDWLPRTPVIWACSVWCSPYSSCFSPRLPYDSSNPLFPCYSRSMISHTYPAGFSFFYWPGGLPGSFPWGWFPIDWGMALHHNKQRTGGQS